MNNSPVTFVSCYDRIEEIVETYRKKWFYTASSMEDFDDVKFGIIEHINKEWAKYNPSRPLEAWVATITRNLWINKLRDTYMGTASPCNACKFNEGDKMCAKFGEQGVECSFFRNWYHNKRYKHQAKMPYSCDDPDHDLNISDFPNRFLDIEKHIELFHPRIKAKLTESEWQIYQRLYIRNLSEQETALELGFRTSEKGKIEGYKRIRDVKKIIIERSKDILREEGLE